MALDSGQAPEFWGKNEVEGKSEMATSTTTRKSSTTERVSSTVSSTEVSYEMTLKINELKKLRRMANELNKKKEALTEEIKSALGDSEAGVFDGEIVVEQSRRSRKSVDYDLLETNFIEAYNATVKQNEYIVLK